MSDSKIYDVPEAFARNALLDTAQFEAMYEQSITDPTSFWAEQAEKFLHWDKHWDTVLDWDFSKGHIRWFEGGQLNACYNCVDRHLETRGDQVALIWEG
ncbi:MAG: acetyl-coenzyme A synthetase, partial [Gammaproteobacteria bacterium]